MTYNYQELIPDQIIDSFYIIIEKCMIEEKSYDNYIKNLLILNISIPEKIKKLLNNE